MNAEHRAGTKGGWVAPGLRLEAFVLMAATPDPPV